MAWIVERFVESLRNPEVLFKKVEKAGLGQDILFMFAVSVLSTTIIMSSGMMDSGIAGIGIALGVSLFIFPFKLLWTAFSQLVTSWIANLLGGKGDFAKTFKAAIYSQSPYLLFSPLILVPGIGPFLWLASSVISLVWSIYIYITGLSKYHRFGAGKAILAWLLSSALLTIAALFVFTVLMIFGMLTMLPVAVMMANATA